MDNKNNKNNKDSKLTELESKIVDIFLANQDLFVDAYKQKDKIIQHAEKVLAMKEEELDKKYLEREDTEQAEKEYLEEYKLIKNIILEETKKLLDKHVASKVDDLKFDV